MGTTPYCPYFCVRSLSQNSKKKLMGTLYSNGERAVKVFQKTQAWTSATPDVKVQMFEQHLTSLKLRYTPAIELIKPRSGSNPFLKVTFISDGEKKEFTRVNKTSANKYEVYR